MKKTVIYTVAIILGILILMFLLNFFAKQKIEGLLENNQIQFKDVNLNLYSNRLEIEQPDFSSGKFNIAAENFEVVDFNYYTYISKGKMVFEDVRLIEPIITLLEKKDPESQNDSKSQKFEKEILIENFQILDGTIKKNAGDSLRPELFFAFSEFKMKNIALDSASIKNPLPFKFGEYVLLGDSLKMKLNKEHDFTVERIRLRDGRVSLEDIRIFTQYDKEEFQQVIPHEKDHYTVSIKEVTLDSLQFENYNDSLKLSNPLLSVNTLNLEVYRDKTNKEDPRIKSLYNEKLRKLPFKIAFENVEVNNSRIVYQEKTQEGNPPGEITFNNASINIENLNNLKGVGKTTMNADAVFMGASGFNFNYSFDVWDMNNSFTASGRLNTMQASQANKFLNPTANIKLQGEVEYLAFNISGNENTATGEMEFKYHDLKVELQNKNSAGEKEFLSALANLFVNNKAMDEEVRQSGITVERDKNKSFWNFIWKVIFKGIKDSVL